MLYISQEDMLIGSNFFMMIGIPASGKSKEAARLKAWDPSTIEIISPSAIREEITGSRTDRSKDKQVFAVVYDELEALLESGKNVVYDSTNCDRHIRLKIIRIVRPFANKIVGIQTSASLTKALRNNDDALYHVPENAMEHMYIKLLKNPPTLLEGFDILAKF